MQHFAQKVRPFKLVRDPLQLFQPPVRGYIAAGEHRRGAQRHRQRGEQYDHAVDTRERGEHAPARKEQGDKAQRDQVRTNICRKFHMLYPTPLTVFMKSAAPISRSFSRRRAMFTYSVFSSI